MTTYYIMDGDIVVEKYEWEDTDEIIVEVI